MKRFLRSVTVLVAAVSLSMLTATSGAAASPMFAEAFVYKRLLNKNSEMCLNIPGGGAEVGDPVAQWPCGTWDDHYWYSQQVRPGWYHLKNRSNHLCLSNDGDTTAGRQLTMENCLPITQESVLWRSVAFDDGALQIINMASGDCLAINGGSHQAGAPAIQWPCGDWADHFWLPFD